nr:D-isomer specific 2-hydroxyacid dehydrogenase family protein [Microterricola pindariensis]
MAASARPAPGPIAVLPEPDPVFVAAVESGGGTVAPLSADTRGVVWLDYRRAGELAGVLRANPQIGWVQLPWAGVDAFAEVMRSEHRDGLLWTSAKGAYAQPVAEHALALSLALARFLPRRIRATSWDDRPDGVSLYGLRVVIVGAGGIAIELLRLLQAFRAHVTVVRRSAEPLPGADVTVSNEALHDVLPEADLVVVAAALTGSTRGLFGAREFALMPETAYFVNVARGGLVETDALVHALHRGTIAGAAVDVTSPEPLPDGHPLWSAPNVIVTPHMADTPTMTAPLLAERIRLNVRAFLGDARFVGIVDPERGY